MRIPSLNMKFFGNVAFTVTITFFLEFLKYKNQIECIFLTTIMTNFPGQKL